MKRGLKGQRRSQLAIRQTGYNRYPDEKGTESLKSFASLLD